jgi:hypothetical protein
MASDNGLLEDGILARDNHSSAARQDSSREEEASSVDELFCEKYHPLARIDRQNTLQTTRFSIMKKDAPFLAAVEASLEYKEGQ